VLRARLALGLAAAALIAGCDDNTPAARKNPPAPPLSKRVVLSGNIPHAQAAEFAGPIRVYRRHVRKQLGAMRGDGRSMRSAIASGDLARARRAWLAADSRYESIGAAYGAFGDLDAATKARLHRIEYALWKQKSARAATPYAARLAVDVARLRASVAHVKIDPFEYGLRAHEVLEDTLSLQLSGKASPWSGAALVALDANVRGTSVVLSSLRALIERRNPARLREAERSLGLLRHAIEDVRGRDGSFPRWDELDQRDRELIGGRTAAAAEQLAFVPELIDTRPARPVQRVFGTGAGQ
jgi:iron uptake system EfeUOB component EfeO/EfeM